MVLLHILCTQLQRQLKLGCRWLPFETFCSRSLEFGGQWQLKINSSADILQVISLPEIKDHKGNPPDHLKLPNLSIKQLAQALEALVVAVVGVHEHASIGKW